MSVYGYQHINIYVMGIDLPNNFYSSTFSTRTIFILSKEGTNVSNILNCIFKLSLIKESKREQLSCVKKSLSHFLPYCNFVCNTCAMPKIRIKTSSWPRLHLFLFLIFYPVPTTALCGSS